MARVLICNVPEEDKPVLDIALSEKNLIVLLSKLRTPGSKLTLINHEVSDEFAYARIRVEPDEYHYAPPTREGASPGVMHPIAELVYTAVKDALDAAAVADAGRARSR